MATVSFRDGGGSQAARALVWAVGTVLAAFLVLPFLVLIPISFNSAPYLEFPPRGFSLQWYENFLGRSGWLDAAWNSLRIGALTVVLSVPIGVGAAWAIVRGRLRCRALITGMIILPIVFPAIVLAIAMYGYFVRLQLIGTALGLVIAHTVLAAPYVVIPVKASLEGIDERLERAARSLGAGPWRAFRTITLPLIRPGLLAGALFAFVTSFDEVVLALFIAGPDTVTLPRKMWESIQVEIDPTSSAAATILILVSFALFGLVSTITRLTVGRGR